MNWRSEATRRRGTGTADEPSKGETDTSLSSSVLPAGVRAPVSLGNRHTHTHFWEEGAWVPHRCMKATAQTKQHSKRNQGTVGLQDWEGQEAGATFVSGQWGDGLLALHPQDGDLLLLLSAGRTAVGWRGL